MQMDRVFSLILLFMFNSCVEVNDTSISTAMNLVDAHFKSEYPDNEPGAAILILKGDSIIFDKGYGISDVSTKSKIDGNTLFNIASVSKQFSAVALLMLVQDGKLSLDDNLKRWFPEFKADFFNEIKLKHILSHSSGIPDSRDRSNLNFVLTSKDVESYSYIKDLNTLNFKPGSSYEYMNPTFQLMYSIIEKASGESFDNFMKDRIFTPSQMYETTYFDAGKDIPRMSHAYIPDSSGNFFKEYDYGEESFFATKADGGIYTSTHEFVKWEKALRKNILISKKLTSLAHSPKILISSLAGESYGYGWFIQEKPGFPTKIYHTGDNGGFQIFAGRYPQKQILYLIFSNRNDKNRDENVLVLDNIFKQAGWLD